MTDHSSVEMLSAYLDAELSTSQRSDVEGHLEDCQECRGRLEGMRRVIGRLERLERSAVPPEVLDQVGHQIRLETARKGVLAKAETRVERLFAKTSIFPTFALVVALAAIVYIFAWGVDRRQLGLPVILDAPSIADEVEESVGGDAKVSESRAFQDRVFELVDGEWRETGSAGIEPEITIDLSAVGSEPWLDRYPELSDLEAEFDGSVVLQLEETWVRVLLAD